MFGFQINPGDRNPSRFATQFQALGKLHSCEINSWPDCQLASITCNTAVYPLPWIIHFYPVVRIGCKVRRRHRQRRGGGETLTRCIGAIFVDSVKVLTGEKCSCACVKNTFLEIGEDKETYLKNREKKKRLEITCTYDIEKKKKKILAIRQN